MKEAKRLKVAVDFDDTLKPFRPPFIDWFNKLSNQSLKVEDAPSYDMSGFMGFASFEEYMQHVDIYHEHETQGKKLTIREDAVEVMRRLRNRVDFLVITARKSRFKEYTKQQMALALPGAEGVAYHLEDFQALSPTKGEFAKREGALVLIDDRPDHVDSAIASGIEGILLSDQFNIGYQGPAFVATDWYDIEEQLNKVLFKGKTSRPLKNV